MAKTPNHESVTEEQFYAYQHFRKPEELNEYLETLGVKKDTPKNIIFSFVDERETEYRWWELSQPQVVEFEASVSRLLEDTADMQPLMIVDDPNYFVAGMVIQLEDGRQIAIRYKCEDCRLIDPNIPDDLEQEVPTELMQEYELVICSDFKSLAWESQFLAAA